MFSYRKVFLLIVLTAAAIASQASAETAAKSGDMAEVPTVEVTGSRLAESIAEVPAPTYVVTREEIEKSGARDLQDALSRVPGVNGLVNSSTMGQDHGVAIRGLNTEVLLLVDGIPYMNNNFGVGAELGSPFDLRSIALSDVERVEVAKGASSALYGSSAAGGVINVITRRGGDRNGGSITLEGGGSGWFRGAARGTVVSGDFKASIGYSRTQEGEVKMRVVDPSTGKTDYARDYRANDYTISMEKGPWSFTGTMGDLKSKWDYTSTWGLPITTEDRQKNKYRRFALSYSEGANTARLFYNKNEKEVWDSSGRTNYDDRTTGATYTRRQNIGELPFVFGVDWRRQEGSYENFDNPYGNSDPYSTTRDEYAPYLETSIPVGEAALDLGLRYEYWKVDNGEDARELLPRISLNWADKNGLMYYATAGRYFNMPSFYEMFGSIPFSLAPNPNLKPEKGWTYDIGLKNETAKNPWNFGLFYMDMSDKINYESDPVTWMGRYVNVDKYRAWGFEGRYKWNISEQWAITKGFAYTHGEQKTGEGEWERTTMPRWDMYYIVNYTEGPWSVEGSLHYYGDRKLTNEVYDDNDIYIFNIAAGWKSDNFGVRLACMNLFDKEYYLNNSGYVVPERRIVLSATWEF